VKLSEWSKETGILPTHPTTETGWRILRYFDRYAASDPYGWDWRTMRIVHPEKCRFWDMLKAEWQKRHPLR
jgi:hypothetical protein